MPVLLRFRQLQREVAPLAACLILIRHRRAVPRLMGSVIETCAQRHDRPERRMCRHIGNALAVDPDLASVAKRVEVLRTGSQHGVSFTKWLQEAAPWRCSSNRYGGAGTPYCDAISGYAWPQLALSDKN